VTPASQEPLAEAVARVLRATSPGDVLTYGQVAVLAGHGGAGRAVGRVLARSEGLPWWRVVTSQGRLVPGHEARQTELLEAEGGALLRGASRSPRDGGPDPEPPS